MKISNDYDNMMKVINADYGLPMSNTELFLTSAPEDVYSSNYANTREISKSLQLIQPVKVVRL